MSDIFNPDFLEFCDCLNAANVDYILVGGYSVILHGYPRTPGDLDIWVARTSDNYKKLVVAFAEFRLPTFDMTEEAFLNVSQFDVFRFGKPPVAIDIITDLKGMTFPECFVNTRNHVFEGVNIRYISFIDLIEAKKAAGRAKDINDIKNLER